MLYGYTYTIIAVLMAAYLGINLKSDQELWIEEKMSSNYHQTLLIVSGGWWSFLQSYFG